MRRLTTMCVGDVEISFTMVHLQGSLLLTSVGISSTRWCRPWMLNDWPGELCMIYIEFPHVRGCSWW